MKFTTSSVLLEGGCRVHLDVYIPSFLLDYDISNEVWQQSINDFNEKLNSRESVTTKINGIDVDVLKLESELSTDFLAMGAVILLIVVKEEDVPKISDIHFCLTGVLTFEDKSGKVDNMVINNITYGGIDSKAFKILNDNNMEAKFR